MPHSQFLGWDDDDRDALAEHKRWKAESCDGCGIHPSLLDPKEGGHRDAVVPEWQFCRVCELVELAKKAGPPGGKDAPGWHLRLKYNPH